MPNQNNNDNLPEDIFADTDTTSQNESAKDNSVISPGNNPPSDEQEVLKKEAPAATSVNAPSQTNAAPKSPKSPEPQNLDKILKEDLMAAREVGHDNAPPAKDKAELKAAPISIKDSGSVPTSPVKEMPEPPESKPRSSKAFIKIMIIITSVVVVLAIAAAVYYFVAVKTENVTETAIEEEEGVNLEEAKEEALEETIEIIDISNWGTYNNKETGFSFKYPQGYIIEKDSLALDRGGNNYQPQLVLKKGTEKIALYIWGNSFKIDEFISLRPTPDINPLSGGIRHKLIQANGGLSIKATSYPDLTGMVSSNINAITAYMPYPEDGPAYIFLYINEEEDNFEEVFKEIIRSIKLKIDIDIDTDTDTDGDGLFDDEEEQYGTDINNPDSDGDGYSDGHEVEAGFNPMGEGKL